jgi:TonB-linked SusC/RagA family outer membrane protein
MAQEPTSSESARGPRFLVATPGATVPTPVDVSRTPVLRARIALDLNGVSVKDALDAIAKQAGIVIWYSDELVRGGQPVRLRASNITVAAALTDVLVDASVDVVFAADGSASLVRRARGRAVIATGVITGRVTDSATHEVVEGALVQVTGSSIRQMTNAEGRYKLTGVPEGPAKLRVTRLGYRPREQNVTVKPDFMTTADFIMVRAPQTLEQVVSTATGDRRRLEIGNSIGTINADSVVPTTLIRNMSDLLQARVPGVVVSNTSGEVGAPSKIRIRGVNSLNLNNDPVIIIDGVRVTSQTTSTFGGANSELNQGNALIGRNYNGTGTQLAPSRLDDLDPASIESIDILKGPSAASLYGTEAANGVIVIKTKRGQVGSWRMNLLGDQGWSTVPGAMPDYWFGWGHEPNGLPTLSAETGTLLNCVLANVAGVSNAPAVTEGTCVIDSVSKYNPSNDPRLSTLGTGTARNLTASLSGGLPMLTEFLSAHGTDQVGLAKASDAETHRLTLLYQGAPPSWLLNPNTQTEYSATSRTNVQIGSALDAALTVDGIYRNILAGASGLPSGGTLGVASTLYSVTSPADTLTYLPSSTQMERATNTSKRGFTSLSSNFTPAHWASFHGSVGGDYTLRGDETLDQVPVGGPTDGVKNSAHSTDRDEDYTSSMDVGGELRFRPLAWLESRTAIGEQYRNTKFYSINVTNGPSTTLAFGSDLISPQPLVTESDAQLYEVSEGRDESATAGWYLEESAAIRDHLYLTAGFRQDVSSAFGTNVNNSSPVYPKYSLSWLLSEEPFMPRFRGLTSLRLRAAYGYSGQQASQTSVQRNFVTTTNVSNGVLVPGIQMTSIGNPDLRPERTGEAEGGFDLSLFGNDRVTVGLTLYRKLSKDAIVPINLAPSYGIPSTGLGAVQMENIGSVQNRGTELQITGKIVDTRPFGWDLTVNYTQNSNKVVHKDPRAQSPNSNTTFKEGYPLYAYFGYQMQSYNDANHDGILAYNEVTWTDSLVFFGAPYPKSETTYLNGFTLFNGMLRVAASFDVIRGMINTLDASPRIALGARCEVDASCSLADQAAAMQALKNTLWMTPSNSVRFQELSLTYNVPGPWIRRYVHAQSGAITFAGRNLALWTNYIDKDPNVDRAYDSSFGDDVSNDGTTLPQPRNWTLRFTLGL